MSDEPAQTPANEQAQPETPQERPLTLLIQQIGTYTAEGNVQKWQWQQATEQQRAQYIMGVRAECLAQCEQRWPSAHHIYHMLPLFIDDEAKNSLSLGQNGLLRNVMPVKQQARIFRALVVPPSDEARQNFLAWAAQALQQPIWDDKTQAVVEALADLWASGSRPPKVVLVPPEAPYETPAEGSEQ